MITVKKSANRAFGLKPDTRGTAETPARTTSLGATSKGLKKKAAEDTNSWTSESAGAPVQGMSNTSMSNNPITIDLDPMMTGITPQIEQAYFHRLYRDMYYHDPVAGSAVDLISSLPFSEFTLGGISDNKISGVFAETLERLSLRTLLPEISVDYLVLGAHTSSLLYNKEKKLFTDIMPHAIENLTMENLPFYSQDPIITVKFNEQVQELLKKDTPRMRRIRDSIGKTIVDKITSGTLELDPLSTLYIPRKTFSTTDSGTSYFRRILPIYLIEKNLFRGTLIESARRQRGIMHISLGDGDEWNPTVQDLEFITDLFMNADSDPLGAIIATRLGVSVEELRQGGDFWKSTDFADSVFSHKLRALGISEGLLSGDANYNTADTSLTVFIEQMRAYREMLTRKLFYDKLFPLISMLNGYTLNSKGKVSIRDNLLASMNPEDAIFRLNDGSKLLIPTIHWAKQLKPEGDTAYMEMLGQMAEKGIPVPLRVMAAAGGLNIDDLLRQQDDDIETRKKMQDYTKRLEQFQPQQAAGEDGDADEATASTLIALASDAPGGKTHSSVIARGGRMGLLNRNFGELGEITASSKSGKKKHYVSNQRAANEKINLGIVRAMRAAHRRGEYDKKPKFVHG